MGNVIIFQNAFKSNRNFKIPRDGFSIPCVDCENMILGPHGFSLPRWECFTIMKRKRKKRPERN